MRRTFPSCNAPSALLKSTRSGRGCAFSSQTRPSASSTLPAFVRQITSRDNPLLVRLRRLSRQPDAYRKLGIVWLEGEHLSNARSVSSTSLTMSGPETDTVTGLPRNGDDGD